MLVINSFLKSKNGGFGDFIRGCISCYRACGNLGYNFTISMEHHPIGKYFKQSPNAKPYNLSAEPIELFQQFGDRKQLQNYIRHNINVKRRRRQLAELNICTNVASEEYVNPRERRFISSFFDLKDEYENEILQNSVISNLNEYECIHIRAGDVIAFNVNLYSDAGHNNEQHIVDCISDQIKEIQSKTHRPLVVLSDSSLVRDLISKQLNIYAPITETRHSAFHDDGLLDTLTDFYILRKSKRIYQFTNSFHCWGSGFSQSAYRLDGVEIVRLKY
jgi:hypothetical protein